MRFCIADDILDAFPEYCVGLVVAQGVDNASPRPELETALAEAAEHARRRLGEQPVREVPGVAVWRDAFSRAGINPNRFPPSIEALLSRVARGGEIAPISPAVDLANVVALRHTLPMGCHDVDRLSADVEARLSRPGHRFQLAEDPP